MHFLNIKNSSYFSIYLQTGLFQHFVPTVDTLVDLEKMSFIHTFINYVCSDGLKKGRKGGGVFQKSTWLLGGVIQKSTSVHKGGGGVKNGQKLVHMV